MNDQQLSHLSALTALNQMMKSSYFDICKLDTVIKVVGAVPDGRAYAILKPLHCMNWMDMPAELRDAVPKLIERCINVPAYQFQSTPLDSDQSRRLASGMLKMLS